MTRSIVGKVVDAVGMLDRSRLVGTIRGRLLTQDKEAFQQALVGNLALETPTDPRTGATVVVLDPLEWIHRITAHIPDPGRPCQRFYGAYSSWLKSYCVRVSSDILIDIFGDIYGQTLDDSGRG